MVSIMASKYYFINGESIDQLKTDCELISENGNAMHFPNSTYHGSDYFLDSSSDSPGHIGTGLFGACMLWQSESAIVSFKDYTVENLTLEHPVPKGMMPRAFSFSFLSDSGPVYASSNHSTNVYWKVQQNDTDTTFTIERRTDTRGNDYFLIDGQYFAKVSTIWIGASSVAAKNVFSAFDYVPTCLVIALCGGGGGGHGGYTRTYSHSGTTYTQHIGGAGGGGGGIGIYVLSFQGKYKGNKYQVTLGRYGNAGSWGESAAAPAGSASYITNLVTGGSISVTGGYGGSYSSSGAQQGYSKKAGVGGKASDGNEASGIFKLYGENGKSGEGNARSTSIATVYSSTNTIGKIDGANGGTSVSGIEGGWGGGASFGAGGNGGQSNQNGAVGSVGGGGGGGGWGKNGATGGRGACVIFY